MKKLLISIILYSFVFVAFAQEKDAKPSDSFMVEGSIKTPFKVELTFISAIRSYELGDIVIKNHLGVDKSKVTKARGILLRDILNLAEPDAASPKAYSEYYLEVTATDGYKVLFSWNELFNNSAGDKIYVLTEMNGTSIEKMDGRIAIISLNDLNNGRRFVKGVVKIRFVRG